MPTPSPVKGGKLPKAEVSTIITDTWCCHVSDYVKIPVGHTVAILPCATKAQAARICKMHNMTRHELRDHVAGIIWNHREIKMEKCWLIADSLIYALGLGGEATR